jgi:DNA-binding transcriptional LysR family regulator
LLPGLPTHRSAAPFARREIPRHHDATLTFQPHLAMNDFTGLTPALLACGGIGELPPVVQPDLVRTGRLVEVMPDWHFRRISHSFIWGTGTFQSHVGCSRNLRRRWHLRYSRRFQLESESVIRMAHGPFPTYGRPAGARDTGPSRSMGHQSFDRRTGQPFIQSGPSKPS